MNAKSAKALRRFMRKTDLDPAETRYKWVVANVRTVEGVKQVPIRRFLDPDCGRATYKRLKPLWA